MNLQSSITELKGIGEKTSLPFAKVGIHTVLDLLEYYPRDYEIYEEPVELTEIESGKKYAVHGFVESVSEVKRFGKYQIFSARLRVGEQVIQATWFNVPFLRRVFQRGSQYIFRGIIAEKNGQYRMEQPEHFTLADYDKLLYVMQPRYPLTTGLTEKMVVKSVHQVIDGGQVYVPEYLPEDMRREYDLESEWDAVRQVHFPANEQVMRQARKRIVFDEFLLFILGIRRMKEQQEELVNEMPMVEVSETARLIEALPYELTNAQMRVWREIVSDMTGTKVMSRLVQGDVGSGKTILAFLAMIMTVENGYQAVLMAPTEVLARQHFQAMEKLLQEQNIDFGHPVLLTGSDTAKEKRKKYALIASKEANLVIGTHALIQEKVQYNNLGLVITDEQHRFGVKQREALTTMGNPPNVLVMSATPIPRTLAIIIYGDLDISVIDELPAQRLPIKNCVVDTSYRPKAYSFMEKQIRQGRQVYVICPMVEESEGMDGENVLDYTLKLRNVFSPDIKIASLHGKMKAKEKNVIMEAFATGEIQILVSTTVVEVGVNVPNATVMMVENAERFGLAQLHQLRGRVGRGEYQSYCIFMQGNGAKEISKRLQILNKSNDGFYIAGEDLKLRGPGDLFGIRQSGLMEFKIGDIYNDAGILKNASEAAGEILALDFDLRLPQHKVLKERLMGYMSEDLENLGI